MAAVAIKLIAPRIPLILKTTLFHSLSLTEESALWDLRTAIIVTTLRSILSDAPSSYERQQKMSLRDPGVKGKLWISRVTLPIPDTDLCRLVFEVIDELKGDDSDSYEKPQLVPVEAEWTGFRASSGAGEPEPCNLTEAEKYTSLMSEVGSDVTMLYCHGGAFYLMDPSSHRLTTSKLAGLTKGRALSVRYRLAPQHPFPAALLDCLVAYLSLLYPSEDCLHEPVRPETIIFAGDSAGGNLAIVLNLLILRFQKTARQLRWNGQNVCLPLPGGVATNSAWCDVTRSMPSIISNAHFDYLPPPVLSSTSPLSAPPACSIWPTNPPRAAMYCDGSMLCHPLVSPLAAPQEMWQNSPPIYFCSGEEMLDDEIRVLAQRCHFMGVKVRYETFEAMPHCFAMLLDWRSPRSARCFEGWSSFMQRAASATLNVPQDEPTDLTGGCRIEFKTGIEQTLVLDTLTAFSDAEVERLMNKGKARLNTAFERTLADRSAKL